jgi:hypothetical protein
MQFAKFFFGPRLQQRQFPGAHIPECGAIGALRPGRPRTDRSNIQRRAFLQGTLPVQTIRQCRRLLDLPSRGPMLTSNLRLTIHI